MKHVFYAVVEGLLRLPRILLFLVLRAIAVRQVVCGIEIIDNLAEVQEASRIPKVAEALKLIGRHDPVLLGRLREHLTAIVVNDSRTAYLPYRRFCVVNGSALDVHSTEEIALALAHEATHAVIHQAGFSYQYEENKRARIEHACVRAEIRLARKLPGGADYLERLQANLRQVWWTDEQLRSAGEAELRNAGWPEWLIRLRRKITPY